MGTGGSVGRVSVLMWRVGRWLGQGSGGVVLCLCEFGYLVKMAGPDICILSRWIPAHLWCTQCSILLCLIDICFLPCIYLWQISRIQTCLCVVVGPEFVSTSPALMRSSASHPGSAWPNCPKMVNRAPITGDGSFRHNLHGSL